MTKKPPAKGSKAQENGSPKPKLLGDYHLSFDRFADLDGVIESFHGEDFKKLALRKRFKRVNKSLANLILSAPDQVFLLYAVIEYINRINEEKILDEDYRFSRFEFWLNHFSHLSEQDNYKVRAKIMGKWVPREEYQRFFPIGMGKRFPGSHFVAAHLSPDTDTMIGSFWGWVDAFAARVSTGLHLWSLPGGPPDAHITTAFEGWFGPSAFSVIARQDKDLSLRGIDLVSKHGLVKKPRHTLGSAIEHNDHKTAVVLIDENGHYLGDWRSSDVETGRQVVTGFNSCLLWLENSLHAKLISLFTRKTLHADDVLPFLSPVFDARVRDCEPSKDFTELQRKHIHEYLRKVIAMEKGLNGTFGELTEALDMLSIPSYGLFQQLLEALPTTSGLFDQSGNLIEDRPKIFLYLEGIIKAIDEATISARSYVERLDMMMAIKHAVVGTTPQFITLRTEAEEVIAKMEEFQYLTVVIPEEDKQLFPIGLVRAADLRKSCLGTVSLRDFCNEDEINMAPYLEVISVVDHHKASLKTSAPPLAIIGDAQSCSVLIAEQTFAINDHYSMGGMMPQSLEKAREAVNNEAPSPRKTRLMQCLLNRQTAEEHGGPYYVHPHREHLEYLCFFYAILDDTDLLSKVSNRDVRCAANLLNKLKSLSVGQDVEIVAFDDIPKNEYFAKKAAQRILKNEDMYSLYKKIYDYKERAVEDNIQHCIVGEPSNIFGDTKEQNRCCRAGQTKIFASNFATFFEHTTTLRQRWYQGVEESYRQKPDFDLHIHMISTITGADEVYFGTAGQYDHRDEIWIWAADTELGLEHLAYFLAAFRHAPEVIHNTMKIELVGPNAQQLDEVFEENFGGIPRSTAKKKDLTDLPLAILHFDAGSINSRKSTISLHLPTLIT